jgi:choline dehydrogenase-like flavoprotein
MKAGKNCQGELMERSKAADETWDYIVIGTGMGGGPLGLKLAQAGFSVLFVEKGLSPFSNSALRGQFAEQFAAEAGETATGPEVLKKAGRFSEPLFDRTKTKKLAPFMGTGVGGSSALYGAVLERFRPSDFETWPIAYEEFAKYYAQAETIFRVRKPDTYRHPENQVLSAYLVQQGLHPYHLPLANDDKKDCGGCQSYLCAKGCKNDSGRICIQTAVEKHGATLLTECTVQKITVQEKRGVSVEAKLHGLPLTLQARNIILAAGALMTPIILQNSGIGNESGLLGRNLMRHYVDLYALKIPSDDLKVPAKELGFNDYYTDQKVTLGTVQSFGRLPPVAVLLSQMQRDLGRAFVLVKPFMKMILSRITSNRLVMTSIIEDSPRFENRVWDDEGKICIAYSISADDQKKIALMRAKMKSLFKKYNVLTIQAAEKNEMLAHVCGTCKMGVDPATSVVDTENKLHGFENIYIADSSFFPTSGGTNPALTIAANSLRLAEILIAKDRAPGLAKT